MKRKSVNFTYQGVEYNVVVIPSVFSCCVEVDIREVVRPDRKWFRTKSVDNRSFFIDQYNTIEEGCKEMLKKYLEEHRVEESRRAKWNKFLTEN